MEERVQDNIQSIHQEDEIDLRELFKTIGKYKLFIFIMMIIGAVTTYLFLYFQTPYYKTSLTIEIKPKEGAGGGVGGGAAALLALSGAGGSSPTSTDRDVAIMQTFDINSKVLQTIPYSIRYFVKDGYKTKEILDNNLSVSKIKILDINKPIVKLKITPISDGKFSLEKINLFSNEFLGHFDFGATLKTSEFQAKFDKLQDFKEEYEVILNTEKRSLFGNIQENLSITSDKKLPFITIDYMDNIPLRGEAYVKNLIEIYSDYAIDMEKKDANISINLLKNQISDIEKNVSKSKEELANYKEQNQIIAPQEQVMAMIKEISSVDVELSTNRYKENLINRLYTLSLKSKNLNSVAPSLVELKDEPTIELIKVLQTLQLERDKLALKYKSQHPEIANINKQISDIENKVRENLKSLKYTIEAKSESLEELKSEYEAKMQSIPKQEEEFKSFTIDNEFNQQLYLYLQQKLSAAEIKRAEAISKIRVIEPLYTNTKAEKPKKTLIFAVSMVTIFILSIFMVFLIEFMRKKDELA